MTMKITGNISFSENSDSIKDDDIEKYFRTSLLITWSVAYYISLYE